MEAGDAVVRSVLAGDGKIFVVMMSRQSGKNELAAVVYAYLLNLYSAHGGSIVVAAPSFKPQIVISDMRLREVLDTPFNRGRWVPRRGYYLEMGKAKLTFFSADPSANVVGATASILLAVDEAQNVDPEIYHRSFRPMASTTGATTVLFGTAWTEDNVIEEQRRTNRRLELETGEKLNFEAPWTVLAAINPTYKAFVEGERARLGEEHVTIRTQYELQAASGAGRLFTPELIRGMRGTYGRRLCPEEGKLYVAGVDIAGRVLEDGRPILNDRDETVVTIAEVQRRLPRTAGDASATPWATSQDLNGPRPVMPAQSNSLSGPAIVRVVAHYHWSGLTHLDQYERVGTLLTSTWNFMRVSVDATGIGAGLASYLMGLMGPRVDPVVFTQKSKSEMGFAMLATAQTGRLTLYEGNGAEDSEECFKQLANTTYKLQAHEIMAWEAADGGHDDYVASLALCIKAANETAPPPIGGMVRPQPDDDEGGW